MTTALGASQLERTLGRSGRNFIWKLPPDEHSTFLTFVSFLFPAFPSTLLSFQPNQPITTPDTMAFPPGGTFFDTLKRNFTDVPVDSGIATTQFLEAAESLTTLFGV